MSMPSIKCLSLIVIHVVKDSLISRVLRHMKANHSSQNVGVRVKQHVIEDLPNVDENSQQHVADIRQSEREKIQQQTIVSRPGS